MNTLAVKNTRGEEGPFQQRVNALRHKIGGMRLSRRKNLSEEEILDIKGITRAKVANIIEFTLLELGVEVNREHIRRIVEEHIDSFPVITKAQEGVLSIEDSEREFVDFLEGRRVKNHEVRLWISGLVKLAMSNEQSQ